MTVLLITKSDDNESIEFVSSAIAERGGKSFRFDTDRFPTEVDFIAEYSRAGEKLTLKSEEGKVDLHDITSVWYRRIDIGARIPQSLDRQMRNASLGETRATVLGMIASLRAFRMDHISHIRFAENKQLQIQVARELGLETPRTLTTNDPAAVKHFTTSCEGRVVAKMLSSFAIHEEGLEKVVFTTPVASADLEDLEGLHLCPMTFQEMVPKQLELRITIVGDRIFAASIDPKLSDRASYDWRRDGVGLLEDWKPYQLPESVERKLLELMDFFGLNYGAIDVIVTPDNRHVFLEVNPVGEFFWLQRCPGLPIAEAIADVLLGKSARRESLFPSSTRGQ